MNDERDAMEELEGSSFVDDSSFRTNEALRKSIHIVTGLLVVSLKYVPWRIAALIAAVAVIGNWLILHRVVGKRVARDARGWDAGIILYPLSVCLLIIIFSWHIELAAVAWAILAFGDGTATLVGRATPIAPLPWNGEKSWGGFLAFLVFGGAAACAVVWLFGRPPISVAIFATFIAAMVESWPLGINDNVSVPLAAATTLAVAGIEPIVLVHPPTVPWPWIAANTILAIVGYLLKSVDDSGALLGWILGAIIIIGGGPPMYVALIAFFVVGTLCTKAGYARKSAAGLAQERGGRRGAEHAFANVGVAAICAIACWRGLGLVPMFMGIAALATATADTAGSEIGQLIGRRSFHPLTFRRVERGTKGAISLEGTLAGIVGALIVAIAGVSMAAHQLRPGFIGTVEIDKMHTIAVVTACAFVGSYLESVVGSYARGVREGVLNLFNTAAGAMLFWIAWHFVPMFGFVF
jgi:uncharacterized protein (TIGR00297 family)